MTNRDVNPQRKSKLEDRDVTPRRPLRRGVMWMGAVVFPLCMGLAACEDKGDAWDEEHMTEAEAQRHEDMENSQQLKRLSDAVTPDSMKDRDTLVGELEQRLEKAEDKIDHMGDEASKDMKQAANKLEKKIDNLENKLAQAKREASKDWRQLTDEVSNELDELEAEVKNL